MAHESVARKSNGCPAQPNTSGSDMFDRRNFLKAPALLAATPMPAAQAGETKAADGSRCLYRRSVAIDGNLGLAHDSAQPVSPDMCWPPSARAG
jgi:hypothetical protein